MDAQNLSIRNLLEDSGSSNVPESWDSINLSYVVEEVDQTAPVENLTHLTPSTVHGVVPQEELDHNPQQALREDYQLTPAQPGDFVVTMSSFESGLEYCSVQGGISPDYTVLRPRVTPAQTNFLKYLFKSDPFIELLSLLSTGIRQGKRIYWTDLKSVRIDVPPSKEAEKISAYLDYKIGEIDDIIGKYEKFSDLLEQRWKLRLSEIMENGLNNTNQVPTEIDWLDTIPEGWEIRKLKYCCNRIVDAINNTAPTTEDGYGYMIRTTQIRDGRLNLEGADMVDKETFTEWNRRETPQGGDLIFTREAPVGEACIIPEDTKITLGQRMMLVRPDESVLLGRYLLLWFYSEMAQYQYELMTRGSTVEHLRVKDVPNLKIPIPSVPKQRTIIDELWSERENCENLSTYIDESISLLKEKRQALITKAITGQIDLSNWTYPEKQEVTT